MGQKSVEGRVDLAGLGAICDLESKAGAASALFGFPQILAEAGGTIREKALDSVG